MWIECARIQWIQIQCALNLGPVWTGLKCSYALQPHRSRGGIKHGSNGKEIVLQVVSES